MFRRLLLIVAVAGVVMPSFSSAQDDEEETYIYATYFYCDTSQEWMADAIANAVLKPAYDATVEAGALTGWGYLVHHTGGQWRRLLYRTGTSVEMLMASFEVVDNNTPDDDTQAANQFGVVCNSHDDYIWRVENGNPGEDFGQVGLSVYFICNESTETRADEIVAETIGPLYQAQVDNGTITSWGWLSHRVGGKYRRLATMSGADYAAIFSARGAILDALFEGDATEAGDEFTQICGSHTDYLWGFEI